MSLPVGTSAANQELEISMKKMHLALTAAVALPMLAGVVATSPASASTVRPNISSSPCGPAQAQWVHLYRVGLAPICVGYTGTLHFSDNVTTEVCAGNNSGSVTYWDNGEHSERFWPGGILTFGSGVDIESVTITGWSGSWTC